MFSAYCAVGGHSISKEKLGYFRNKDDLQSVFLKLKLISKIWQICLICLIFLPILLIS